MFIVCALLISLFGCLLHFLYEISGYKKPFALFSAVNESVWEHVKIAIIPTFLFSIFYLIFAHPNFNNFLVATAVSLLSLIILIPVVFYFVEFLTKKTIVWLDIVEFFLDILASQFLFSILISGPNAGPFSLKTALYAGLIIILIFLATICYTFRPPKGFLFEDSRNGKYGLRAVIKKRRNRRRH